MTINDPRSGLDASGPACRGHLASQTEVDRAVTAITDYCRRTGRPLTEVATEILEGRLVIGADTVRAPRSEVLDRPA